MTSRQPTLADDLLDGAEEIAEFVFGDRTKVRKIYYMVETGALPVVRKGRLIMARRSALEAAFTCERA